MKIYKLRFWVIFFLMCTVLTLLCGFIPIARFGAVFFGILTVCSGGELLMVKLSDIYKPCKTVAKIGEVLFSIFVASFVIIQFFIFSGQYTDEEYKTAQYVLVLGAKINDDRPSASLKSRLDKAIEVSKENKQAVFIVCGGQGDNEIMPEAVVMKKYLLENGLSSDRVLIEDKSKNTIQNIQNAKNLYNLQEYKTAVITSDFHLARARRLMKFYGLDDCGIAAKTPYLGVKIVSHLREYCSTLGLILTGRYF